MQKMFYNKKQSLVYFGSRIFGQQMLLQVAWCMKVDLGAACSKYPGRLLEMQDHGPLAPQKTSNLHVNQMPWGIVCTLESEQLVTLIPEEKLSKAQPLLKLMMLLRSTLVMVTTNKQGEIAVSSPYSLGGSLSTEEIQRCSKDNPVA